LCKALKGVYCMAGKADVFIQAGHENRTKGKTGAESRWGREKDWTKIVADVASHELGLRDISVIREDAFLFGKYNVKLALFIHFEGSESPCEAGASIGYNDATDKPAADAWRKLYSKYWKFPWMPDNYTKNLSGYYGFNFTVTTDSELVLELGEITCKEQALWLRSNLELIGKLIADFAESRVKK
jgi:hypothetical protein